MQTGDDRFRVISSNTEVVYVNGLATALRILIPAALVGAIAVGALAWAKSAIDAVPAGESGISRPAPYTPQATEYRPAQHVNPATEIEEQSDAF